MSKAKFNKTNKNVGWAAYTWSPVTGCLGPAGDGKLCPYCYANRMTQRFGQSFKPTFHPERLDAPRNTKISKDSNNRVFVCSMGELFGPWIPDKWICQIFDVVHANPQWTFLFLTKCPGRLSTLQWPKNAWIGATIDRQERTQKTIDSIVDLRKVGIKNKLFLSCEPILEEIKIPVLGWMNIDWLIIGALSKGAKKVQPDPEWVKFLFLQAHQYSVPVWFKDNLIFRPQEVPND